MPKSSRVELLNIATDRTFPRWQVVETPGGADLRSTAGDVVHIPQEVMDADFLSTLEWCKETMARLGK